MAIVYRHVETINDEARRDDDGAAVRPNPRWHA
jgi:hypothetical protein